MAVLCGTHPELPYQAISGAAPGAALQEGDDDPELAEHATLLAARLAQFDAQRQQFWLALLLACTQRRPRAVPG